MKDYNKFLEEVVNTGSMEESSPTWTIHQELELVSLGKGDFIPTKFKIDNEGILRNQTPIEINGLITMEGDLVVKKEKKISKYAINQGYTLTSYGYMEGDLEIIDFKVHRSDKGLGFRGMSKIAKYQLQNVINYLRKNKDKNIRLDNILVEEEALLFYLGLEFKTNQPPNNFKQELEDSKLSLRTWIEQKVAHNAPLSNTLWIFDYKGISPQPDKEYIPLSNFSSYHRPDVLKLDNKIYNEFKPKVKKCVILPCSSKKPYHSKKVDLVNKTPSRFQGENKFTIARYVENPEYEKIVLSSLGFIPQDFWGEDVVMNYDTGVRDVWKILCLGKKFFEKNKFDEYQIVVKFKPYRDLIRVLMDMGVIDKDKVTFVEEDEKPNGGRIMFYPKEYTLYD